MIVRKRFLAVLCALVMALTLLPGPALAATADWGPCGSKDDPNSNVIWSYDDATYVLTFKGRGTMQDYQHDWEYAVIPWRTYMREIKHIVVEEGVSRIGNETFGSLYGSVDGSLCPNVESISIGDSVEEIGEYAFYAFPLPSIKFPKSLKTIEDAAFYTSELESITIPDGTISIGRGAFQECVSLTSVSIPNSVTTIKDGAFAFCENLTSITLSNNMGAIADETFIGCSNLADVTIPSSVTSIRSRAFLGCDNLSDVYYGGSKADWQTVVISSYNDPLLNATIHYNSTGPSDVPDDGQLHGKVVAVPTYAASGKTVTLYITPDPGYKVSFLTVTDNDGNRRVLVTHTGHSGNMNTYTFLMPAYDVTVHTKFTKI